MIERSFIAQIQKGLDLEHHTSLKPGPGSKLGTDTAHTHTYTHTHRIMYRLAPQVKSGSIAAKKVKNRKVGSHL